jgi:electron transfer flavoprotein alpha subunit
MPSGILVLIEHKSGELLPISPELLGAARRLADASGQRVTAVAFGSGASQAGQNAIAYGADAALVAKDASRDEYANDTWTAALTAASAEIDPAIVLLGQTDVGRDVAPRFAICAGSAVATDCIDLSLQDGRLLMTRPCFGGKAHAQLTCKTDPQVATLRVKAFEPLPPDASRSGEVRTLTLENLTSGAKTLARSEVQAESVPLEDAAIVVAGGRGLGSADAFDELRALAQALGGALGSSRPPIDAGWAPPSSQVGLTGKVVAPGLYLALGISGASQHLAGVTGTRNIVAVNRDKDADIFKVARYGVVTDCRAFLPAFIEECRKLKS